MEHHDRNSLTQPAWQASLDHDHESRSHGLLNSSVHAVQVKHCVCVCACVHVEKACTHVCKVPVCVCLWASRASSEENVAPHWSHTSASAGAVDKIKFKRVCFDQTWTQTCVCNCSLSQLISHLKRTVEKSNERGGTKRCCLKSQQRALFVTHLCFSGVNTRKQMCRVQWSSGKRRKNTTGDKQKHQTGCNGPSSRKKKKEKKEQSWRVLFTVPCYQSLNSEQTVCLRGHRRTGCSLYSRRFPPAAHPFIKKNTSESTPRIPLHTL